VYQIDGLITRGKITDNANLRDAFVNGGQRAYQDYADAMTLRQTWWTRILSEAAIPPAELTPENWQWLSVAVDEKIRSVKKNCVEVQLLAAVAVQDHFLQKPETIHDEQIRKLLTRFTKATEDEQRLIIPELTACLRRQSFLYLEKQAGIPLLENLK